MHDDHGDILYAFHTIINREVREREAREEELARFTRLASRTKSRLHGLGYESSGAEESDGDTKKSDDDDESDDNEMQAWKQGVFENDYLKERQLAVQAAEAEQAAWAVQRAAAWAAAEARAADASADKTDGGGGDDDGNDDDAIGGGGGGGGGCGGKGQRRKPKSHGKKTGAECF